MLFKNIFPFPFLNVLSLCKRLVFSLALPSDEIFLSSRVIAHLLPTFLLQLMLSMSLEER